jgi:Cu/Ag efflux protein CusF
MPPPTAPPAIDAFGCDAHLISTDGGLTAHHEAVGSLAGTNPAPVAYRASSNNPEISMKVAKIIFAGTAALAIIGSAALAQDPLTGTVTKVDRISSVIAIQPTQSGTVGANTGGTALEFKTQDGALLDTLHAGDKVTFSVTETGGVKAITKLQKQ